MRIRALAVFLLSVFFLPVTVLAIDADEHFEDPVVQQRYENIIRQVRCLQCQNESIADSNAMLAADLRREIRQLIREDYTDEQIYSWLTARYGDFVLFRPPFQANTLLLWLAPALLILIGGGAFAMILSARATQPLDDDELNDDEDDLDENNGMNDRLGRTARRGAADRTGGIEG